MNVAYSKTDLDQYLNEAVAINNDSPIVVSKFIMGAKENRSRCRSIRGCQVDGYI